MVQKQCYVVFDRPDKKAAIGYTYEDSTPAPTNSETDLLDKDEEEAEESSDEEIDLGEYYFIVSLFHCSGSANSEICVESV